MISNDGRMVLPPEPRRSVLPSLGAGDGGGGRYGGPCMDGGRRRDWRNGGDGAVAEHWSDDRYQNLKQERGSGYILFIFV